MKYSIDEQIQFVEKMIQECNNNSSHLISCTCCKYYDRCSSISHDSTPEEWIHDLRNANEIINKIDAAMIIGEIK